MSRPPQPKIGARRHSRECALQLLYQIDGRQPEGGVAGLTTLLAHFWKHSDPEAAQSKETTGYAEELFLGVVENRAAVDGAIQKAAQHWKMERMSQVDRNVLRLGTYELLFGEVPSGIIINEAIELAKAFGTEESGGFVNGVLDRVAELANRPKE